MRGTAIGSGRPTATPHTLIPANRCGGERVIRERHRDRDRGTVGEAVGQGPNLSLADLDGAAPVRNRGDQRRIRSPGKGGALIERNCGAGHPPDVIATQPPLEVSRLKATIDKMRTVYKAKIEPADAAALVRT